MELPVEDLRHDAVGKRDQVVVGGRPIERRAARHGGHWTSPVHIARAATARQVRPEIGLETQVTVWLAVRDDVRTVIIENAA